MPFITKWVAECQRGGGQEGVGLLQGTGGPAALHPSTPDSQAPHAQAQALLHKPWPRTRVRDGDPVDPWRGARGCPAQAEVGVAGGRGSQALRGAALAVAAVRGAGERAQRGGPAGEEAAQGVQRRAQPSLRSVPAPEAAHLCPGRAPSSPARRHLLGRGLQRPLLPLADGHRGQGEAAQAYGRYPLGRAS